MAPKPIAVVAADTHLDELIWNDRPEISGDAFFGFRQTVDLALDRQLPLIIAGDVVECLPTNAPSSAVIAFLREQLDRFADAAPARFLCCNGQHDVTPASTTPWPVAIGHGDCYRHNQVVPIDGVNFGFLSHMPGTMLKSWAQDLQCDVLICHQIWKELMGGSSVEGSVVDVHPDVRLLISGDLHQFKVVRVQRKNGELVAASPGATYMRKLGEPVDHFALIVRDDLSVVKKRLRSRVVLKFDLHDEQSFEELYQSLPEQIEIAADMAADRQLPASVRKPLFRVVDHSNIRGTKDRLSQVIGQQVHLKYSRRSSNTVVVAGETSKAFDADHFLRQHAMAEIGDDREVQDLFNASFEAENVKDALVDLRRSFLAT